MPTNISSLQLFIILVNISFGAGLIELPRKLAGIAREDMWLSALLCGVTMMIAVACAVKLSAYFSQATSIEYHCILLGPTFGQILNSILIVQLIFITGTILRFFSATLKVFLFDLTPFGIIACIFLLLVTYAGQYGFAVHIRVQQLIFLVMPLFVAIIVLGVLAVDIRHFKPFFTAGMIPIMRGIVPAWLSYTGAELVIGLLYPFLKQQRQALKTSLAALMAVTGLVTLVVFMVQGILGVENTEHQIYAAVIAYREVEVPETFIERIDGYLIALWIFNFFTSLAALLYYTAFGLSRMLRLEDSRPAVWLLVPIVFLVAVVPTSLFEVEVLIGWVNVIGIIWGLVILPGLLGLTWWRAKRGMINANR